MRQKSKQRAIGFTERHEEMIREIMDKRGYSNISQVVQQAVVELHEKLFKDYVLAKTGGLQSKTPEERARLKTDEKEAMKKIKEENEEKAQINLCNALGGKLVEDASGGKTCHYYTYNRTTKFLQEIPIGYLTDDLLDNQFLPSKEEVQKLLEAKGESL